MGIAPVPRRWHEGVVRELARVLPPGPAARSVLTTAGFPSEHVPSSLGVSSLDFWHEVDEKLASGVLEDGFREVLAVTRTRFPANPVFSDHSIRSALFVSASPQSGRRLRTDRELRAVLDAAEPAGVQVTPCPAADITDLRKILSARPDLLHLACHGDGQDLLFEYATGREHRIGAAVVVNVLRAYRENGDLRLRAVVLESCSSSDVAEVFTEVADTVVAHQGPLHDDCAVAFSGEFYRLLGELGDVGGAARIAAEHVAVQRHLCASMRTDLVVLEPARL